LEHMTQTPGLYWRPAFIRDPASIKTMPTCHIKLFSCVYGVRDLKNETHLSFIIKTVPASATCR